VVERVILAEPRGFCAGVIRAIDTVEQALSIFGPPIYVRRQIVHNPFVVEDLERKGAVFVEEVDEVPSGGRVIFSAHGIAPIVKTMAAQRGLKMIDATCPLVTKVHLEAVRYAREGYSIILVGHAGHDEVIGTMGEAPDRMVLVGAKEEAESVQVEDPERVAVVTQTTLSVDDTREIVQTLRRRFPKMAVPSRSDICFATQNRQDAVKLLADQADLVLVLGAENSSNSQRLREVAETSGCPAHLITSLRELDPAWLEGVRTVGITSGASTPESLVAEVLGYFRKQGNIAFETLRAVEENVQFALPRALNGARSAK
jgi:4-hydroxy-3-methylbut-2-enyl diphosphate reductase